MKMENNNREFNNKRKEIGGEGSREEENGLVI